MAINYLNNIDLNKNQIQNGVIHVLAGPPSNPVEGQIYYNSTDSRLYFYDGSNWIDASGDIKSVTTQTSNQLTITDPNGPNPRVDVVTGAITNGGTALVTSGDIYTYVTNGIAAISVTINGTTSEVEVTTTGTGQTFGDGDTITIGLPNDVTIANDLTVTNALDVDGNVTLGTTTSNTVQIAGNTTINGDLTVNGTTTTVNSNVVEIGDSIITLNADETGAPSQDAGIEIERGTSPNRSLLWDESAGEWVIQQNTGTYERIATYADSVEDVTVTAASGSGINITETLSGTDNRIKQYDLSLDFADFSYKTSIGNGSTLAYAVSHNLGTLDVIVQLYDTATYETVYADVVRNSVNQVTVTFASAPASGAIRVLIQKL
jgi:hypothetical protein